MIYEDKFYSLYNNYSYHHFNPYEKDYDEQAYERGREAKQRYNTRISRSRKEKLIQAFHSSATRRLSTHPVTLSKIWQK